MASLPYAGTAGVVTQVYGVNPAMYASFRVPAPGGGTQPLRGHDGEDIGLPQGTPLYAPESGVVGVAHDPPGYGDYVTVTVPDASDPANAMWLLGHMSEIDVADGSYVQAGQYVGLSGGTPGTRGAGHSSGPHTHIGYRAYGWNQPGVIDNGFDGWIDPAPVLAGSARPDVLSPITAQPDTSNTLPYDPNYPPAQSFRFPAFPLPVVPLALAAGGLLLLAAASD